jgi:hypothetical protein
MKGDLGRPCHFSERKPFNNVIPTHTKPYRLQNNKQKGLSPIQKDKPRLKIHP